MSSSLISSGGSSSSLSSCSLSSSSSQTTSFTNTVHLPPPITRIATLFFENSSPLDSSHHESEQKTEKEFSAKTETSQPDQSRPLYPICVNFENADTLIGTQKWEVIKKYNNCFNLFKVDSEDTVYFLNGEKTLLKLSVFAKGILKTMHVHLAQPDLSKDCEFSKNVDGRFFDVQFKGGNLTIISAEEVVNSGGSGTVFRALDLTIGEVVAQKIANFSLPNLSSPDPLWIDAIVSSFYDEHRTAQILPKNEHYICATNIICAQNLNLEPATSKLIASEQSRSLKWLGYRLSLILPFRSKGDLFSLSAEKLSLHTRIQLASSVWKLNQKLLLTDRFWHRDIKPENYMVLTFPQLALIDWAGAKQRSFLDNETNLDPTKFPGHTPQSYCSEMRDQLAVAFSEKNSELTARLLDQQMLYMTATTMFTVLCNSSPRPLKEDNFQDMSKAINDAFLKYYYPPLLANFILKLLESDPKKRLSSWEEADKRFREIVYKTEDVLDHVF